MTNSQYYTTILAEEGKGTLVVSLVALTERRSRQKSVKGWAGRQEQADLSEIYILCAKLKIGDLERSL